MRLVAVFLMLVLALAAASFAIHGDTYVPRQPASHGCVRIPMDIAEFFHTLVPAPGTPVYVR